MQIQNGRNGDRKRRALERASYGITRWVGSVPSLIAHTLLFGGAFFLIYLGFDFDRVLLGLTTIVSLEAIYLAIFIQMSINRSAVQLEEVEMEIEEIQENVEDIQEGVEEIIEEAEETESQKLEKIEQSLLTVVKEIDELKKKAT